MEIEQKEIYNALQLQNCHTILNNQKKSKKNPRGVLSLGCPLLNKKIGGIKQGFLTEICGDAGTGKTNFCIQILLNSIMDQQSKTIKYKGIYISTQKPLHVEKWQKISQKFASKYGLKQADIQNSVIMRHLTSAFEFKNFFHQTLANSAELEQGIIRVIIIDNITTLCQEFMDQAGNNNDKFFKVDMFERSKFLKQLGNNLKSMSFKHGMAIVVTNNMIANDFRKGNAKVLDTKIHSTRPSLGLLWSNIINERFHIRKMSSLEMVALPEDIKNDEVKKRRITVLLSPRLALKEVSFYIDNEGVKGTNQW